MVSSFEARFAKAKQEVYAAAAEVAGLPSFKERVDAIEAEGGRLARAEQRVIDACNDSVNKVASRVLVHPEVLAEVLEGLGDAARSAAVRGPLTAAAAAARADRLLDRRRLQ